MTLSPYLRKETLQQFRFLGGGGGGITVELGGPSSYMGGTNDIFLYTVLYAQRGLLGGGIVGLDSH